MAQCRIKKNTAFSGGFTFMRIEFDLFGFFGVFFAVGRVLSQLEGGSLPEHTEYLCVMSWCRLHPPWLYFIRNGVCLDRGVCCQLDLLQNLPCRNPVTAPALRFLGFLYRPCGAAMQQRNPAPPQPPGRSMWQLPCKIPKSLQRHLVPAWENRWEHWQGWFSACFSF